MAQESPGRVRPRRRRSRLAVLAMVLALGGAGACGPSDPWNRQAISGVVTLDGLALDEGAILLEPMAEDGGGMAVGATIRRGAFAIARAQGATPGSYRVRVYASSGRQAPPEKGQSERSRRPMVERLPGIYNTKSELRMDVVAGGPNHLRLDLHREGGS